MKSCCNGTALINTGNIPQEGANVEAVGKFWNEKKRGRKGKIVQIGPEEGSVVVVWNDDAKRVCYKLISNLKHAKDAPIFNWFCY